MTASVVGSAQAHRARTNPWVTLGLWDLYFFGKFFLFFGNFIGFHFFENLAFAAFLALPLTHEAWNRARRLLAIPVAIGLFYYDTWLPPASRLWSAATEISDFDSEYLLELAGRFVNLWVIAGLVLLYAAYMLVRQKLRMTTFVLLGMAATQIPWIGDQTSGGTTDFLALTKSNSGVSANAAAWAESPPKDSDLNQVLESFYATEAQRSVAFTAPKADDPPFDILVLQICSLSWDDLDFVKEREHPLFGQFDLVFNNFSSATSYSGPAVLRLLRSSAGHQRHVNLYEPIDPRAQTFENLRAVGFSPHWAMNHDGRYGNFLTEIRTSGGLNGSGFNNKNALPYLKSFDGSAILDDYSVLSQWWEQRLKAASPRVALFYNTISLHDGNRLAERNRESLAPYHLRLQKLLADISKFFALIEKSDRKVVVVFIPEHGASIRGDKVQIAGMREYPSFSIGHVPVGVKFIGQTQQPKPPPYVFTQPSSYLAVSKLISEMINHNPFVDNGFDPRETERTLPVTGYVAENSDAIVMRYGARYYLQSRKSSWTEY